MKDSIEGNSTRDDIGPRVPGGVRRARIEDTLTRPDVPSHVGPESPKVR